MKILVALLAVGAVGALVRALKAYHARSCVSPAWLVDAERRSWGIGVDQVCVSWPINKLANEAAWRNRKRRVA